MANHTDDLNNCCLISDEEIEDGQLDYAIPFESAFQYRLKISGLDTRSSSTNLRVHLNHLGINQSIKREKNSTVGHVAFNTLKEYDKLCCAHI